MVGRDCLLELGARNKTFKSGEGVGRESRGIDRRYVMRGKEEGSRCSVAERGIRQMD